MPSRGDPSPSPAPQLAAATPAPAGERLEERRGPRVVIAYPESSRVTASGAASGVAPEPVPHLLSHNPNLSEAPIPEGPIPEGPIERDRPRLAAPMLGQNFAGQGNSTSMATITGTPPDTNGAVGPNHYVQLVNGGMEIWDKSGNVKWGSQLLNVLWTGYVGTNAGNQCATRNDGDPVVLYDQMADRWFITQFSVPNNKGPDYQCVAVSKTGDPTPTAGYWLYDFEYPFFNDYGKVSVWPDAYYATFNDFTHKFGGSDLCAYDRASMLAGLPATQQCFQQTTAVFGVLPTSMDGKVTPPRGEPGFFMNFGTNALNLWKFHVDWVTPANTVLSAPISIPVTAFTPACNGGTCIPQPSGTKLDSLADRLMFRIAYRNYGTHESLVVNHAVTQNAVSGVRWYEIRSPAAGPTVFQQGTYQPDTNWRWMGSIAQDQAQGFGLGFSVSSSTLFASIAVTGRVATDPLGTMGQGETRVATGTAGEAGATRWGDYSAMTVDPVDDCTFWYTNEYYLTQGAVTWDTRIASFKLPNCAANDFTIGVSPTPQSVMDGGMANFTVTTAVKQGTPETIVLNVQDLPSGVTAVFNPASVAAGSSSTLTLTASATAPVTPSPTPAFTVIGTAPSAVHPATAQLAVVATCVPLTTCPAGDNCGTVPDGCGGMLSCGTCTAPQTCGGGTPPNPNVCGCTPLMACPAGDNCGTVPDGCGGTVACGICPGTEVCMNNVCMAGGTSSSSTGSSSSSGTSSSSTGSSSSSTGASSSSSGASSSSTGASSSSTGASSSSTGTSSSSSSSGSSSTTGASSSSGMGGSSTSSSGTGGMGGAAASSSSTGTGGSTSSASGTGGSTSSSSTGTGLGTGGSSSASGAGGGEIMGPGSGGHCACETAGSPAGSSAPLASFGLLALAAALRPRRRAGARTASPRT